MSNRFRNPIPGVSRNRQDVGFDSYLGNDVQKPKCALSPSYDEARKDFDIAGFAARCEAYLG